MADPNGHRRLPTGEPDQANASPSRPVSAVDGVTGGEGEATYSYFPPGAYEPTALAYSIRDAANDDERARHDQGGGAHDHHNDRPRQDQRGEAHLHDRSGEKSEVPIGPSALSSTSAGQQGNGTADTDMTPLAAPAKISYDVNFPPLHEHRAAPTPEPLPVQGDEAPDHRDPPRQDQRGGAHPHDLPGEKTIGSDPDILDDYKRRMINTGPQHDRITTSNGFSGKGKGVSYAGDKPASNSSSSTSADKQGSDTTDTPTSDTDITPSAATENSYDVNFPPLHEQRTVPNPAPAVALAAAASSSSSTAVGGAMSASSAPAATRIGSYKTLLCMQWREGRCHNGDACRYAHGEEDQRILRGMRGGGGGRPCPDLATKGWCKFGVNCRYGHGGV